MRFMAIRSKLTSIMAKYRIRLKFLRSHKPKYNLGWFKKLTVINKEVMGVLNTIITIIAVLIGLGTGALVGLYGNKIVNRRRLQEAHEGAELLKSEALKDKRAIIIEAKEESLRIRTATESELREQRFEIKDSGRRLNKREEQLDRRNHNLEIREKTWNEKENELEIAGNEVKEVLNKQLELLENMSGISNQEAESILLEKASGEIQHEVSRRYRDYEERAREEAEGKARNIIGQAIHRLASDVVSEMTIASVSLPSDDMKGRLIGRDGRNIRAIEKATGVDLIIDDTPEQVTLSCFDPVRREIAKMAISKLVADGRIHPARIEEIVSKSEEEIWANIWKSGEDAVFKTGIRGLHPEIVKLLGKLKYRYSYGENVLLHSIEVGNLAAMIAAELGANVKIAKTGGLLHDLGKALSHEVEGGHAKIGADIAAKYKVSKAICDCIADHHDDQPSSVEGFVVAAADAISAARPGARMDTLEHYIERIEALEEVAAGFDGVEKCYAIQAGREIRVLVKPDNVDDLKASDLARQIANKIEETLVYPGQIKVTVIRESRSIELAQ